LDVLFASFNADGRYSLPFLSSLDVL
jgi:hypothetical protein